MEHPNVKVMERELIQKELDALKGTKFDKVTDAWLALIEDNSQLCKRCGRTVANMEKHQPSCIKLHSIALEIIRTNDVDMSIKGICKKYNLGTSSQMKVSNILKYLGHVPYWTKTNQENTSRISTVIANNPQATRAEIALMARVSIRAVQYRKRGKPEHKPKMAQYHDQIFSLYNSGKSPNAIANILGVCYVTVTRYIKDNQDCVKRID
jgi:hypothetical protein